MNINEITIQDGVKGMKPLFDENEKDTAQNIIRELQGMSIQEATDILEKCILGIRNIAFIQI